MSSPKATITAKRDSERHADDQQCPVGGGADDDHHDHLRSQVCTDPRPHVVESVPTDALFDGRTNERMKSRIRSRFVTSINEITKTLRRSRNVANNREGRAVAWLVPHATMPFPRRSTWASNRGRAG